MDKYLDQYNLLTSESHTEYQENSILFSVEYYLLTKNPAYEPILNKNISKCKVYKGMYNQHPSGALQGDDRFMSHDQLTAIFSFSKVEKLEYHKEIWKEIKRQWFRYNNVNVPSNFKQKLLNKRFLHPRDIIFYGICAGSLVCKMLSPLLIIMMFITQISKKTVKAHGGIYLDTDGKLLNYVRLRSFKNKTMWKFFTYITKKRFGSWGNIFKIYFRHDDHPNVIESKEI